MTKPRRMEMATSKTIEDFFHKQGGTGTLPGRLWSSLLRYGNDHLQSMGKPLLAFILHGQQVDRQTALANGDHISISVAALRLAEPHLKGLRGYGDLARQLLQGYLEQA